MCSTIIRLFIILGIALAVCEAGHVLCLRRQPIHSCESMSCPVISDAVTLKHYPCECFEVEIVLGKKKKWYQIELPDGQQGYVTDDHCSSNGNVPQC
ncbi:unnamed protein product [Adineta steineri]|uniref:SH3 domain-containing protein n=1 Tax=Adineta steineri TaxID=433720 RepID=A0A813R2K1_9BILA|nr:unnamed protein product [Adineta steineri]CAF0798297.1 unnamed protein product [Adineta steineri]CAF3805405.1 unnamed protein product [Adineta steineri]CAF4085295.1 unnamed protein product [Adineta steineri]